MAVSIVALSILLGCQAGHDENISSSFYSNLADAASPNAKVPLSIALGNEELPLSIALKNPKFAGYYCSSGDLMVGVAIGSSADTQEIVSIVASSGVSFYCRTRAVPDHDPKIVPVERNYSFLQLRSWRNELTDAFLNSTGARSIGIDFEKNKIVLDVDVGRVSVADALLSSHSVPENAVEVRERQGGAPTLSCQPPPTSGTILKNCFRPVPGSVQTNILGGGFCTLAVGGRRVSTSQEGWVTASHCVPPRGQNDNKQLFQPSSNEPGNYIGVEEIDPPTFQCGIGSCRWSDSAWIRHEGGSVQRGQIVQTNWWNGTYGCCDSACTACTTSTSNPRFHVYGAAPVVQGMQIEKIGRTTGWTTGTISDTCNAHTQDGILFPCQVVSENLISDYGDSGSPVFYWWSSYYVNTVEMLGVLWYGGVGSPAKFSSWGSVIYELGDIDIRYAPIWQNIASSDANDIGVGASGSVWITSNTSTYGGFTIKRWNGIGGWDTIPGGAVRLAVDPSGKAWVVNSFGNIFKWTGSAWQAMPGSAVDIGIGANGSIWIVGTAPAPGGNAIYVWNGSGWTVVAGGASRIAVDPSGNPWFIASDGTIWRRSGGSEYQLPGAALDIGVGGDGMVWVLGTSSGYGGHPIFWWSGIDWVLSPGLATAISVARGGKPWVVNSLNQVFRAL